MMENADNKLEKKNAEGNPRQEIHSKVIRAGKRTYFFDVKSTRHDEYYLTITESKKKYFEDGKFHYEKHKVFLYPEDFEKFTDAFHDVIGFINKNQPGGQAEKPAAEEEKEPEQENVSVESEVETKGFSDVDFEDI